VKICEIYYSIQGESSFAGFPFCFIRLVGCNLRCRYCDTRYAYKGGEEIPLEKVIKRIEKFRTKRVLITGGEPLLQEEVYPLCDYLLEQGFTVLVETNGSIRIDRINPKVYRIVDLKCPTSGMTEKMDFSNLELLTKRDELKFVIGERRDYIWAKAIIKENRLEDKTNILFSPVYRKLSPAVLAEWILKDHLNVRFQIQLHKYIWKNKRRI